MVIRFQFEIDKAMQALSYLLEKLGGSTDKAKLMKLLYYADREHFLKSGSPITGDAQVAMPYGPVPSACLNLVNGEFNESFDAYAYISLNGRQVTLKQNPGVSRLSDDEQKTLDTVLGEHGAKHTGALIRESHRLPEYIEAYPEGERTSVPIPYELILSHYHNGDEAKYRLSRPVISREMMNQSLCPFTESEADL